MAKSKKQARKQAKAQKAKAQARERAMPPGPVRVDCRDESGRTIDAICYPPDPRYVLERGRWRRRFYSPRWREARERWMGVDLSHQPDLMATVVMDGRTGEILMVDDHVLHDAARRSAGHHAR